MSASDSKDKYAGKTLVLSFTNIVEWRVIIGSGGNDVAVAIRRAMTESGLECSRMIDPISINFRIEE